MQVPATFRYVAFYDLLADAVFQHRLSTHSTESYVMNRHARSSILAAALSVECAANCLLNSLELSGSLKDDLDKLPALAKIETYLEISHIGALDRGRNEIQKVVELVKARNDYVHPKVSTINADVTSVKDAGAEWQLPMSLHGEMWTALAIPKRSMFWSKESSLSVLAAIASFFNYLFIELMQAAPDHLHEFLPSRLEIGDAHILAIFEEFKNELKGVAEHGVDFSFFGIFQPTP